MLIICTHYLQSSLFRLPITVLLYAGGDFGELNLNIPRQPHLRKAFVSGCRSSHDNALSGFVKLKKTIMDSIEKVNKLCKSVLKLTEQDLQAVDTMAQDQASYTHPLKGAKQAKFNKLGNHNQRVLSALQNLRQVLIDGEPK